MFKIGDYVVNAKNGVCKIEDIQEMNISGKAKEYYLLIPQGEQNAKIFIPLDTASGRIRLAMTKEQALELIRDIHTIEELSIENERERESLYKDILNSCNPRLMVSVIKTIYLRRQDRQNLGKKTTAVDEHYFKVSENHLHNELAFALQIPKDQVKKVLLQTMNESVKL